MGRNINQQTGWGSQKIAFGRAWRGTHIVLLSYWTRGISESTRVYSFQKGVSGSSGVAHRNCRLTLARRDQGSCDMGGAMCVRACVCVCFLSVCVCLCLCVKMYHGRFSMSIGEMESKERSYRHVGLCERELQMRVRKLWCAQGRCDVDAVMCVRACNFVWLYLCVCLWFWLPNDERWECVRIMLPSISYEQWTPS